MSLWILWFPTRPARVLRAAAVLAAFVAACLPSLPFLWHYREVHRAFGFTRGIDEIIGFSADITALVSAPPHLAVLGRPAREPAPEAQLFPGLTVVVLIGWRAVGAKEPAADRASCRGPRRGWLRRGLLTAAVAATLVAIALPILGAWKLDLFGVTLSVRRISRPISVAVVLWLLALAQSRRVQRLVTSQSPLAFYVIATVLMWVLAFGPLPAFNGQRVMYWAPYRWLLLLPGFESLRVPARFAMLAALTLSAAASVAVARLVVRVPVWSRTIAIAGLGVCVVAEGWFHGMPLIQPPAPSVLSAENAMGAVLELPAGGADVAAMYRSFGHGQPVANGYSGYFPPVYQAMRAGLESFDPDTLTGLASLGVRHVVVFDSGGSGDDPWNDYVGGFAGASRETAANGQTLYTLAPAMLQDPVPAGDPLPVAQMTSELYPESLSRLQDGDTDTAWESGQPQTGSPSEYLTVDLGMPVRVAGVDLIQGIYRTTYPRWLVIERATDCATWDLVWQGPTAALTLRAAVREPAGVPIAIRFEPVDTRCLRLRQTGQGGRDVWAIGELAIRGAPSSSSGR